MIGSEKTAGRRQAGKIKKPADFSTEGKTAGRSLGAVPPGFVPKRHALIFRNGERRCRLKKFGGTARRRLSPFSAAAFAPDGCSLGVGGNGYSSASKRFLLSRLFYRRGGGFVKVGRGFLRGICAGRGDRAAAPPAAGRRKGRPRRGRPEGGRSPPGCRPIWDPRRVYWSQGVCSSLSSPSSKARASRAFWAMACRRASTSGKRRSGRRKWQRVTVSSWPYRSPEKSRR